MTGVLQTNRDADEYAWLLNQATALRDRRGVDIDALAAFIEESAEEMLSRVTSQMVNLIAHLTKAAYTRNPEALGHWRSECAEFHDQIIDSYRPSMRQKIDMDILWRRAKRKVYASFQDYGEPRPDLPEECPLTFGQVTGHDLNFENVVQMMRLRNDNQDLDWRMVDP
jgi:hypothetical protein